jgi:hypothetical protein
MYLKICASSWSLSKAIIAGYSVSRCQELCCAEIKVLSISYAFKTTVMKHITPKPKQITELYRLFLKTQRRNLTYKV